MSEYLHGTGLGATTWGRALQPKIKIDGAPATIVDLSTFQRTMKAGKIAAAAKAGPFGLPRWALPVGVGVAVLAVAYVIHKKKRRK